MLRAQNCGKFEIIHVNGFVFDKKKICNFIEIYYFIYTRHINDHQNPYPYK